MEKHVNDQIISYLEDNVLLYSLQGGFRKRKQSTIKSVFNMVYDVYLTKNEHKYSLALSLDICKAFDCVNHKLLLQKLEEIGIGDKCKDWLCNFLTERTQYVMNQGIRSKYAKVNTGIPQGSNLGPTLFLIYVIDMYCMNLKSTVAQFADDTVLYYSDNDIDVLCNTVQKDLNEVSGWCCFNKLKVNAAKMKAMFFDVRSTGQKAHLANMNINSSPVEYVDKW